MGNWKRSDYPSDMRGIAPLFFICLVFAAPSQGQPTVDGFVARMYKSSAGQSMPYRLFMPPGYDKTQKYPLVVWLHGAGSVGTDNLKQISSASRPGTHTWTRPEVQAKHPAFVVAPQAERSWAGADSKELSSSLSSVLEIIESLKKEFTVDPQRIYVAGQSMGGYGTWELISKRPEAFAAAIPLCGGGNPGRAAAMTKIAIWAFHGEADPTVSVYESRKMIEAIKAAGGKPRYSEYKGVGHNVWDRAFKEPELVEWVFAQSR
jgi:predicted peptidase